MPGPFPFGKSRAGRGWGAPSASGASGVSGRGAARSGAERAAEGQREEGEREGAREEGREGVSSGGDGGTAVTSPRGLYSWGRVWVPRLVPAAAPQRLCGSVCLSLSLCLSLSPSLPRIYGLYFLEGCAARMRVQLVCVVLLALASCSLCSGE